MAMEKTAQTIANHGPLTDFATDDNGTTPGGWPGALRGRQQGWLGRHDAQHHPGAIEALGLAIKAIEDPKAPQPVPLGQNHLRPSDR